MVKKLFFIFCGMILSQMSFAQQPPMMFCNGGWSTNCNQQQQGVPNPQQDGRISFQCRPGLRPIPMQNGFQCIPIQQQRPMQTGQQRPVCTQGLRPVPMQNGGYQCIPIQQQMQPIQQPIQQPLQPMQHHRHRPHHGGPMMHMM